MLSNAIDCMWLQAVPWCLVGPWWEDRWFLCMQPLWNSKARGSGMLFTLYLHCFYDIFLYFGSLHVQCSGIILNNDWMNFTVWWGRKAKRDGKELSREVYSLLWKMGDQPIGMFQTSSLSKCASKVMSLRFSVLPNDLRSGDSASVVIMVYTALIFCCLLLFCVWRILL